VSVTVSVVIVTYNSERWIGACLDSLRQYSRGVDYEVVVVDNASSDATVSLIRDAYPWARVIARATNAGLSGAINDGVAASGGRYAMVLNPDTRLRDDALTTLARFLEAPPDTGVVAPTLLDEDGTLQFSCRAFPGYSTALFGRYSIITRLFPRNPYSRDYLMRDFDHATVWDVDWVSGAAMMFPRAVFDQLGGWDAGFFMFNEDVDFCKRVHQAGLRVVYQPDTALYHAIGVSKRAPARIVLARHRSMWRYYRKHLRGSIVRDVVTAAGIAARCTWVLAGNAVTAALRPRRAAISRPGRP
jgi:GT2 family glycosyltransferase